MLPVPAVLKRPDRDVDRIKPGQRVVPVACRPVRVVQRGKEGDEDSGERVLRGAASS